MKKGLFHIHAFLAIMFLVGSAGVSNAKTLSFEGSLGFGKSMSPAKMSDGYPTAFTFSSDLVYMLTTNFGLTPISFTFRKFNADVEELTYIWVKEAELHRNWASNFDRVKSSMWSICFSPGIVLTTSGSSKVKSFAQIGAGVRYNKSHDTGWFGVFDYDEESSSTDPMLLFGGGLEVKLNNQVSLLSKVRYNLIFADEKSISLIDFLGGVKLYIK